MGKWMGQNKDEFRPWKHNIKDLGFGKWKKIWSMGWSGEASCQIAEKGKQSLGVANLIWRWEGARGCGWDTIEICTRPNLLCIIIVCYMYCAALHLLYTLVIVSQLQWYVMSFKPLILQYKLCGYYALCIRSRIGKFFLWTVSCI